jgi:hypothetical protein
MPIQVGFGWGRGRRVIKTTIAGAKCRMAKASLRAPGRPPIDETDTSTEVGVTVPTKQFDAYAKRALEDDVSVPEIIRRDLDETARRRRINIDKP